jgi:hypothetical protein
MGPGRNRSELVSAGLAAAFALPLVVHTAIGSFSRYTADDYCWAGVLRTEGFFNAQALWYTGYSPRYAFTFLVNLVELAGPAIVPVLPAMAIVVLVATVFWTVRQFGLTRVAAVLLAEGAALATLETAPDLPQSLYWQTAMLTYLLPLILATFLIGWIRKGIRTWWAVAISGLVTFVAGGLSETYLIPQNVAITLALGIWVALALRHTDCATLRVPHLGAALAGGVLALIFIVVAPATTYRVGGSPADLRLASFAAIATAGVQILQLLRHSAPIVLTCLVLPGIVAVSQARVNRRTFWLVTACAMITLPFCYFPSFYAQNGNPPARSLIVPGAILIGYLLFVGYTFRGLLQRMAKPWRIVVAALVVVASIRVMLVHLPEPALAAQYAALWDAEDQQIRATRDAGQMDVVVPPLPRNLGEDFVTPDRDNWFNVCVARYYGVRSIAAGS